MEQLEPGAAAFLNLIAKARPGITHVEALANGAHYRAKLASTGMSADDYATWCREHRGLALIVHLDGGDRPDGVHKLLPLYAAERFVAGNPNSCIVAAWGVSQ